MRIALLLALGWLVTASFDGGTAAADAPRNGQLFFGWASESITPDQPVAIGGQYHTRISGQVHDPLTATALAIETRDDRGVIDQAVMVSCDLSLIRRQTQERVRQLVKDQLPDLDVEKILISATHTHTAPSLTDADETDLHPYDFIGSWAYRIPADQTGVMRPAQYLAFLEQRIGAAVVKAWQARQPGGLSSALSHASIARNRRAVYADGTARMYGNTNDPDFSHIEGASDDSVDVLFFWRNNERPEGMVINVYCPAQEVEGESYLSADFWNDARARLREKYHADLFVLPLGWRQRRPVAALALEQAGRSRHAAAAEPQHARGDRAADRACGRRCLRSGPQQRSHGTAVSTPRGTACRCRSGRSPTSGMPKRRPPTKPARTRRRSWPVRTTSTGESAGR